MGGSWDHFNSKNKPEVPSNPGFWPRRLCKTASAHGMGSLVVGAWFFLVCKCLKKWKKPAENRRKCEKKAAEMLKKPAKNPRKNFFRQKRFFTGKVFFLRKIFFRENAPALQHCRAWGISAEKIFSKNFQNIFLKFSDVAKFWKFCKTCENSDFAKKSLGWS